jgi:exodeoxyribonuclease III
MDIATFNVNGIKARLDGLTQWLKEAKPDVVCLQEIKCETEAFPREAIEDLGYNAAVHGQKGFNGVAILSRRPIDDQSAGLPGNDGSDTHSRWIEAVTTSERGAVVRVCGLYLPNGNPTGTEKFVYKLAWMDRLTAHARDLLKLEENLVLAGDFNVIPTPNDARRPDDWLNDALFQPETRSKFRELVYLGFTDALRAADPSGQPFTFWDYQAGAFQKNNGIRIDHLLLSPQAADHLTGCRVDKHVRGWERPSDHVPVVATLDL